MEKSVINAARMEAALDLLTAMMEEEAEDRTPMLGIGDLNYVLIVAGYKPVEVKQQKEVEVIDTVRSEG